MRRYLVYPLIILAACGSVVATADRIIEDPKISEDIYMLSEEMMLDIIKGRNQ